MQESTTKVSRPKNLRFFEFVGLQGKGLHSCCEQKTTRCENLPKTPRPAERPRRWSKRDRCGLRRSRTQTLRKIHNSIPEFELDSRSSSARSVVMLTGGAALVSVWDQRLIDAIMNRRRRPVALRPPPQRCRGALRSRVQPVFNEDSRQNPLTTLASRLTV
jgi:hypothetical protein